METMFSISEKIATPISLAALAILVLFYLFKILLERLNLAEILGKNLYKLVLRSVTYIFILAITALCVGILAFVFVQYINFKNSYRADAYINKLTDESIDVRATAARALWALATQSGGLGPIACASLSALVRRRASDTLVGNHSVLAADIQESMTGISQIAAKEQCTDVDLRGSDLRRLQLPGGHLAGANLVKARLDQANLSDADLRTARLVGAVFTEAVLRGAKLSGAALNQVTWRDVDLRQSDLNSAQGIAGADLSSSRLDGIILDNVDVTKTRFPQHFSPK
ncbi:pentapeptide repeat-containing protein [Inquilinus sp. YAF38]|uniref:pentapeptide repeat-containing protein n=1 Tax=Inquilinus sp. YAF38 TaxID=3233084 RepID=UPI003F921C4D